MQRIQQVFAQAIEERGATLRHIAQRYGRAGDPSELIARTLGKRRGRVCVSVRTLARLADAMQYDVIIQLRDRREALVLQQEG